MRTFFIKQRGKTYGPLDQETIRSLILARKLHPQDLIADNTDGPWYNAKGVKGLEQPFLEMQRTPKKVDKTADHFLTASQLDNSRLPDSLVRNLKQFAAPGVLCQWAPDGFAQFSTPKAVVKFSPDGGFAFFADSKTGIPISELEISQAGFGSHDVFLSHSSKDESVTATVCKSLETSGVRCWLSSRDIPPGANWGEAIIDGINASRVMVVIITFNSNTSRHVMREVERAVNFGIPIIPIRIHDIPLSKSLEYFLSTANWLNAFTPPLQGHLDILADRVGNLITSDQ